MGEQMNNSMGEAPFYNLRAVVTQTGLNPATIRAWERRYGLPKPVRSDGGHRQYSQRDIDTLKWLIARQDEGISISHAIDMWRSYVERGDDPIQGTESSVQTAQVIASLEGKQINEMRRAWKQACLEFDRKTAEQILASAFAQYNPETVVMELLQKGLAEIGNGWYQGDITVQQEHFASALSIQRLEILIAAAPPPTRDQRLVLATAPDDYHIFSPLLMTYLLRRRGWDVIYLGANVPSEEMEDTILQLEPALVIISAQLLHTAATLKGVAQVLYDNDVPLAFGGSIFNKMPELVRLIPGHYLGNSLDAAVRKAADLAGQPSAEITWDEDPAEAYEQALLQFQSKKAAMESFIWERFLTTNQPTKYLEEINHDISSTIEAALMLGDVSLLPQEFSWIEYLLMGYRLPVSVVVNYVKAYYEAAMLFLGDECKDVVEWLEVMNGE